MAKMEIKQINLSSVRPDPDQPRKSRDPEKFIATVESIRAEGVKNAIDVRVDPEPKNGFRYMIVNGEGRYLASLQAGKKMIPAIIRDYRVGKEVLLHQLMDNEVRENMALKDVIRAYQRIIDSGVPIEKMAKSIGRKVSAIEADLLLLNLQEKFLDLVSSGKIPITVGRLFAEVKPSKQEALYPRIVRAGSTKEKLAVVKIYLNECRQEVFAFDEEAGPPKKSMDNRTVQQFTGQFFSMVSKMAESPISKDPAIIAKGSRKRLDELEKAANFLAETSKAMKSAIAEQRAKQG